MVKVRFAPSPTGNLHIGGARTALFNWMYARAQGGQFVLRIEDTDLERSRPEYEKEIMDSMRWLGLSWDELYKQSDRFEIYREHVDKLLSQGDEVAYKKDGAVFLNIKALHQRRTHKQVAVDDLIRGRVMFDIMFLYAPQAEDGVVWEEGQLRDEVLMKADGAPTYSFACVVDDALMGITHVIRGEDHLTNTPKQVLMYEALGYGDRIPKFAHLPMIMGEDGAKMSKRHGATAVTDYKKMGFLPEALVNYLMLLGWSPGNEEILPLKSACAKFSIKKVNKAAAQFNMEKLRWINAQYIKTADTGRITDLLVPILTGEGLVDSAVDRVWLERVVGLYKSRMSTLWDFVERAGYLFSDDVVISPQVRQEHLKAELAPVLEALAERLEAVEAFDIASAEAAFRTFANEKGLKTGDLVHPVRVALTGDTVGPGLFETMAVLGKTRTIARLKKTFRD